jgi:nicotinate-nucleotide pyrophosphorylase (carboxylating)
MLPPLIIKDTVERALKEDLGLGDLTTFYAVSPQARGNGRIFARKEGIIAGLPVAEAAFLQMDNTAKIELPVADGDRVQAGQVILEVTGCLSSILVAERTALNFLQRLSGIATKTAAWVEEIKNYPVRLADTRKTTPGLRLLEKYAVAAGGGSNHRLALDGGILIKENHITAAGGIEAAVKSVKARAPFTLRIEVEVTDLVELEEALKAKADIIMLDNMNLEMMRQAVALTAGRAVLEASGNVTFERLKEIAATGVDIISCGALTHSYRSLDLSLLIDR